MDRKLTTRPRFVLIFEVTQEKLDALTAEQGAALVNLDLPNDVVTKIGDYLEGLEFGQEPDLSRFGLPDGVTLRVERLTPDRPRAMLAVDGPEVPKYRDRMKNYVPEGLNLDADGRPPWVVEVGEYDHNRRLVGAGIGLADALNRDYHGRWTWADVSPEQDGSHWAHFDGHHTQVDISVSTYNYRDTHDWKGKENVRGRAKWTVALDRVQVGEGYARTWEAAHRAAAEYARRMQEDVSPMYGLTSSWRDAEKELLGRPVWYREQPAYIDMVLLDQGCVVVKPAMADDFTVDPRFGDEFSQDERDSAKIELLSESIYWYRDGAENDLNKYSREEQPA